MLVALPLSRPPLTVVARSPSQCLQTLTDEEFLDDPELANPWTRQGQEVR